jgi:hypothetical protein
MGICYEYYRAEDRETALVDPERSRMDVMSSSGLPGFDVVETKWICPEVVLGQLVAFIAEVDFSLELVQTADLYPPPEGRPKSGEEWDALPDDSPYREGPGIDELPVYARDVLAGMDDSRLPAIARRWGTIEGFSRFTADDGTYLLSLTEELVGLARRAKDSGQMLYCWICL